MRGPGCHLDNELSSRYYVAGGTLAASACSYVIRRADSELLAALANGEFCYVLDTRQVGKSSLIVHVATELMERGYMTAFLDLSTSGDAPTEDQWYGKLLADLSRATHCEDEADAFWDANIRFSSAQRWFFFLRDVVIPRLTQPLIVFIDEIESVRKLPFSTDGFFAILRGIHNLRALETTSSKLTFCVAGVATPSELIRDPSTTPFNIGRRVALRDFSVSEMSQFERGLHGAESLRTQQLKRIAYWTSGHPYLTQRFCQAVAETGRALSGRDIDRVANQVFFRRHAQSDEFNLQFVRRQLLDDLSPVDILTLYARVQSGDRVQVTGTDPTVDRLLLSGAACLNDELDIPELKIRNRIYATVFDRAWVLTHLPGAEQRRQRQAFWRGVARASAIWGTIALVFGYISWRELQLATQRARISQLSNQMSVSDANLRQKSAEIAAAQQRLAGLNGSILARDRKLDQLKATEMTLSSEYRNQQRQLHETKHLEQVANARVADVEKKAITIREDSEQQRQSALALMGSAVSGSEYEAISHGLAAIEPAIRRRQVPPKTALDGLAHAVNAGAFRLFQLQHPYRLETAEFSPDGNRIVTAGYSRDICLWNALTGALEHRVPVLPDTVKAPHVYSASFSPDGKHLITAGNDQQACIWDVSTLASGSPLCLKRIAAGNASASVVLAACSASGRYLAVSGRSSQGYRATVYSTQTYKQVAQGSYPALIMSLTFNTQHRNIRAPQNEEEDRYLAITGRGGQYACVLDLLNAHESKYAFHNCTANRAVFATWCNDLFVGSDSGRIATASANQIGGEDTTIDSPNLLLSHRGPISSIAASPDGDYLAASGFDDCEVHVWDINRFAFPLFTMRSHASRVASVKFSPDSKRVVSAGYDGVAEVWLMDKRLYSVGPQVNWVALSPDGQRMVAPSYRKVSMFSTQPLGHGSPERWEMQWVGDHGPDQFDAMVYHAAYSADGRLLATAAAAGDVRLWRIDKDSGRATSCVRLSGHDTKQVVNTVAISPNSKLLASASDDCSVRIWNITSRVQERVITHPEHVITCAFSQDSSELATGCADGITRLFNVQNGALIRSWQPPGVRGVDAQHYPWSVTFSPDNRFVLTADADGSAYLFERRAGGSAISLPAHHGIVFSANSSPDGHRIVTATEAGIAEIWNTDDVIADALHGKTPVPLVSLRVASGPLYGAQFSLDGDYIFAGGKDGAVIRMPVTVGALVRDARRILAEGSEHTTQFEPAPVSVPKGAPNPKAISVSHRFLPEAGQ